MRRRLTGGVFVPASLLRTASEDVCGTDIPETGSSAHSTLILGGLGRARLRCRDVSSAPSSGPAYGGPCESSVLAASHCLVQCGFNDKEAFERASSPPSTSEASRMGPLRYRRVNGASGSASTPYPGKIQTNLQPRLDGTVVVHSDRPR